MSEETKALPPIARNMKALRAKMDISQDRLAKLADISFHTITKIETGDTPNPTVDTMKRIADALGVTIDDLIKE